LVIDLSGIRVLERPTELGILSDVGGWMSGAGWFVFGLWFLVFVL
jgi:hypothetical protein